MQLRLLKPYKSITALASPELPRFTVIVGDNGAGKSQLLRGIYDKVVAVEDGGRRLDKIHYHAQPLRADIELRDRFGEVEAWTKQIYSRRGEPGARHGRANQDPPFDFWLGELAKQCGGDESKVTMDHIRTLLPGLVERRPLDYPQDHHYLQIPLMSACRSYLERFRENVLNEFLVSKGLAERKVLSDTEFRAAFGPPPWELANELLGVAGLTVGGLTLSWDSTAQDGNLELRNQHGDVVQPSDLSSGEGILLSLVANLYRSEAKGVFPDLILFDEALSGLHPRMLRGFLDGLVPVLDRHKFRCIVVSHSPSLAALAPEGSVFRMKARPHTIEPATRDAAVRSLTAGIPTLGITLEHRRQVLVESQIDAKWYETLYDALVNMTAPPADMTGEVSLSFVGVGRERGGGCDQVRRMVGEMKAAGNATIRGLLDWDRGSNSSTDEIAVLGQDERYSIESVLLDPLIVATLIARLNPTALGVDQIRAYPPTARDDHARAQMCIDAVLAKAREHRGVATSQGESRVTVRYVGGAMLEVELWYLHYRGHDLGEVLLNAFPPLRDYHRGNGAADRALCEAALKYVVRDCPWMVPNAVAVALARVQQ